MSLQKKLKQKKLNKNEVFVSSFLKQKMFYIFCKGQAFFVSSFLKQKMETKKDSLFLSNILKQKQKSYFCFCQVRSSIFYFKRYFVFNSFYTPFINCFFIIIDIIFWDCQIFTNLSEKPTKIRFLSAFR